MHRIDTPDSTGDGLFQGGNPNVGQQATQVDADWLNDVQENLAYSILQANIALVKGDKTQLYAAMVAIAQGVLGVGGDGAGAVATTRKILGSGLVSGGGDLSGDRTLSVAAASTDEAFAGVSNLKAMTPASLASNASAGARGYVKLPGGIVMQWGGLRAAATEGVFTDNFVIPFPTSCDRVQLTTVNSTASGLRDVWPQLVSSDVNGFTGLYNWAGQATGVNNIDGIDWFAIGR